MPQLKGCKKGDLLAPRACSWNKAGNLLAVYRPHSLTGPTLSRALSHNL